MTAFPSFLPSAAHELYMRNCLYEIAFVAVVRVIVGVRRRRRAAAKPIIVQRREETLHAEILFPRTRCQFLSARIPFRFLRSE